MRRKVKGIGSPSARAGGAEVYPSVIYPSLAIDAPPRSPGAFISWRDSKAGTRLSWSPAVWGKFCPRRRDTGA
jgi:hypothetical protein